MQRRSLLAVLATGGIGAIAGCNGLTGPIKQQSLTICDTDCDWDSKTPKAGKSPIVERYPDERRVVVYGHMYVGSSSCNRAVLKSAQVTDSSLTIVVGVGDKGNNPMGGACTADISSDKYRVIIRLRTELPERVVVEEKPGWDPSETPTDG